VTALVPPRHSRSAAYWWIVGGGAALFGLSALVATRGLSTPEWQVFDLFNEVPASLAWALVAVMPLGSGAASIVLPVLLAALRRVDLVLCAAFAGPVAWLVAQIGKSLQIRGRPVDVLDEFLPSGEATGAGFPSGHTAVAVAFAVALWPFVPRRGRPILVALAVAVAIARMHVGVHLPLDLVGGAGVGLVAGGAALLLIRRPG
jgi:undecaprenyl-diphosphatase